MIIDHPDGLHERVAYGRTDELEAPLLEVLAHGVRYRRMRRNIAQVLPFVHDLLAIDKIPEIHIKTSKLLPDIDDRFRIDYGRVDLELVPYDAGIAQQPEDLQVRITGNLVDIKIIIPQ